MKEWQMVQFLLPLWNERLVSNVPFVFVKSFRWSEPGCSSLLKVVRSAVELDFFKSDRLALE